MSGNWTPGPWRLEEDCDEIAIVGLPGEGYRRHGVGGEWTVATIDTDDLLPDSQIASNARLIAAAPELLEALEPFAAVAEYAAFLSAADSDYIDVAPFTAGQYRAAAAAVAKVRGAA